MSLLKSKKRTIGFESKLRIYSHHWANKIKKINFKSIMLRACLNLTYFKCLETWFLSNFESNKMSIELDLKNAEQWSREPLCHMKQKKLSYTIKLFFFASVFMLLQNCTSKKYSAQSEVNNNTSTCQTGWTLVNGNCVINQTTTASCSLQSSIILSNQTILAYNQFSVPNGQVCVSESRTCTNGMLSGSFLYTSCSVLPAVPVVPPTSNLKPAFVANGHLGRTLVSCDDGRTWIKNRSDNNIDRCWEPPSNIDCDHHSGAPRGLTINNGNIYANFGWGAPGSLRKSIDGTNWISVRSGQSGGGVGSMGNSILLLWGDTWHRSTNDGVTWSIITDTTATYGVNTPHMSHLKNRLGISGRSGNVIFTTDGGQTFYTAQGFNQSWLNWTERRPDGGMAEGNNGIIVAMSSVGSGGGGGRSADGGHTWSAISINEADNIIHTGTEFFAWSNGQVYRSSNGSSWTTTPTNYQEGPISYNTVTRTFVWILNTWGRWYEQQKAYRSTDGINWTELNSTAFTGGHPIENIQFGMVNSAICP
jgi:hypothetical protein